jgi:hypothetical protein
MYNNDKTESSGKIATSPAILNDENAKSFSTVNTIEIR